MIRIFIITLSCTIYNHLYREDSSTHDSDDALLSVEDRSHQQQSTMDAINSAMTASLDALGGDEIKELSDEQRTQLLMFMDCVETEPEPSIKYLRDAHWDVERAIEGYFQQHPDHPKSRGGSLQFDLSQLHDIYAEDFEADIQLPDDIVHKTKAKAAASGRRDSTELDELPNGDGWLNHGQRSHPLFTCSVLAMGGIITVWYTYPVSQY
eukprot:236033_1